jgi:hypothetical protein
MGCLVPKISHISELTRMLKRFNLNDVHTRTVNLFIMEMNKTQITNLTPKVKTLKKNDYVALAEEVLQNLSGRLY